MDSDIKLLEKFNEFEADVDFLQKNRDNLRKEFGNKFIVIKHGQIVSNSCNLDEAIEIASKHRIDLSSAVVEFIESEEGLLIL